MIKKVDLLSFLETQHDQDARQVAEAFHLSSEASGMMLLRLFRHGLLKREVDPGDHVFFYSLTPKGRSRLDYLRKDQLSRSHHAQTSERPEPSPQGNPVSI